jgi:hypothetical protein
VKTVSLQQVGQEELALPPRVQEALGELVGSAKEGLLALSVGVGLRRAGRTARGRGGRGRGREGQAYERTAVRHATGRTR